jgi:general L-amino acid transport system substrate-binding protein
MKNLVLKGVLGASALVLLASAASAGTLDDVKKKGFVQCGVNTGLAGFAAPNDKGEWSGFDVDYCRAVAAAVFGDGTKVKFTPLSAKDRLPALQSGEIDVLIRNTTWTLSRDTQGFDFTGVTYYDGQGFMINAKKLSGRQFRTAALRCIGLRSGRYNNRAQSRRLLQSEQDGVQSGRVREARRSQRCL